MTCQKLFGLLVRRHHCRRCGNIFCDEHSRGRVPLDQNAHYNPRGSLSRSCDHCYVEYLAFRSQTNSTVSSEDSTPLLNTPASATPFRPFTPRRPASPVCSPNCYLNNNGPYDWNWSTF